MKKNTLLLIACCLLLQACQKDFLDQRPNKALLVPATLADMQALLDNNFIFNNTPGLTFIADGDFYTTDAGYNGYNTDMERNSYTWAKDIFAGVPAPDWNLPYQQVFYANVVLAGADKLPAADPAGKNAVRGTALFFRAFAFFNLLQQFAAPYDAGSVSPGIPLPLTADVNVKLPRAGLQQGYAQVLADLAAARSLLPKSTAYKSRPTVRAVQALQARVRLAMGDYVTAGKYADSVLAAGAELIDYNTLNPGANRPFPRALPNGNGEVIFYAAQIPYSFNNSAAPTFIDSGLYCSYDANDLRKVLFCRQLSLGNFKFKGNYAGTLLYFSGLATDELYLIGAECRARAGDAPAAMELLNTLLAKRWLAGTYLPYTAANAGGALALVLAERRKELLGRNLRWGDLRRLNADPQFKLTLQRKVNGSSYTLEPGSRRYIYPIPDEEIRLGGLTQNQR